MKEKEYLRKLVNNVAILYDLSIKLNNSPIVKDNHPESVEKLSEFLRYLYERISILVKLPERLTIEDNFYPFSTYAAFIQNNNDNKDFLEDLSYAIDEIVRKLRETPIFDKDRTIESLPRTQIDKVSELIEDYDLQKIKEIADKLSESIKAAPFLTIVWQEEVQRFLQDKTIKEKDKTIKEKDKTIEEKDSELEKTKSKLYRANDESSKKASKDFSEEYRKIREELKEEIAPFWQKKKDDKDSEKKGSCLEKISKKIRDLKSVFKLKSRQDFLNEFCQIVSVCKISAAIVFVAASYWLFVANNGSVLSWFVAVATFVFLRCFVFRRFNLHLKIFSLRLVTYAIPIFLILFHFCEFFYPEIMHEIIAKNAPDSKPYIYFHVALGATLLIAYQQLRGAISETNIKKNLVEIYRHRELVARNYDIMHGLVDVPQDKTEVVKSAAKALFENEPSIYGNNTNPMPPKAFDINNNILPKS